MSCKYILRLTAHSNGRAEKRRPPLNFTVGQRVKKSAALSEVFMSDDIESNFDKYVMGQTMGKMHVISVHLWLEHLLVECLKVVVPNPTPLFRDRGMGFAQLVSLCEAHQVVNKALAEILRKVNGLRNKCAHQLTFSPHDDDWMALDKAIEDVAPSRGNDEGVDSLRRLAEHLEDRAIAIGAIAPSAAQQGAPADVLASSSLRQGRG